jgi:aspartate racemase
MKTIGLIGGMSWESSAHYYRLLNEGVKARLGGLHSARCILASVDFGEIEPLQRAGRWDDAGAILNRAALGLERAGPADRQEVNRVIFEELVLGRIEPRSKARYVEIMNALAAAGAQAVIAGCTEITMLVQQPDIAVPLFDTTELHALAAVERALAPDGR